MGLFSLITGRKGPSGFGSASTAEEVTQGIDASHLTAIITGTHTYTFTYIDTLFTQKASHVFFSPVLRR